MHPNIWKALRSIAIKELQKLFDSQIIFLFKYILIYQEAGAHLPLCSRKHVYFKVINDQGHVIQHWEIMSHRTPFVDFGSEVGTFCQPVLPNYSTSIYQGIYPPFPDPSIPSYLRKYEFAICKKWIKPTMLNVNVNDLPYQHSSETKSPEMGF